MLETEIKEIIKDSFDTYAGAASFTAKIVNEVDFGLLETRDSELYVNIQYGAPEKVNDYSDRIEQQFTISILSREKSYATAKAICENVFINLARTIHDIDDYKAKIFLKGPVPLGTYQEIENGFGNEFVMTGSYIITKTSMLSIKTYLAVMSNNAYGEYTELHVVNPSHEKISRGTSTVKSDNNQAEEIIVESVGNQYTFTVLCGSATTGVLNDLLEECFSKKSKKFKYKVAFPNTKTFEIENLIVFSAKHVFVEDEGEHGLNITLVKSI